MGVVLHTKLCAKNLLVNYMNKLRTHGGAVVQVALRFISCGSSCQWGRRFESNPDIQVPPQLSLPLIFLLLFIGKKKKEKENGKLYLSKVIQVQPH